MTPIRKGSNPVKIPFAIKSSDRTFAAWANETRTALQQLEARIPTANIGRGTTGGGATKPAFWATISKVPDSSDYQVTFSEGYLTYHNAGAAEADLGTTGYIAPKINGIAMDSEDVEPLPLPDLASFVYLRVKTDADGVPKFDGESVTIEAFDGAQQSIHHVRPSPSGGEEEGDYYFLLLETESNGATTPAPRAKRRITGNVHLPNQLVEIANVGEKRELYKGYKVGPDDKHEIRTLEQLETRGEAIIKPLPEGEDEEDTIKFKSIDGRLSNPQINVTASGNDVVQIEGNSNYTGTGGFAAILGVADGLVESVTDVAFGLDQTVSILDGCGTTLHVMTFEKGLLTAYELTGV